MFFFFPERTESFVKKDPWEWTPYPGTSVKNPGNTHKIVSASVASQDAANRGKFESVWFVIPEAKNVFMSVVTRRANILEMGG